MKAAPSLSYTHTLSLSSFVLLLISHTLSTLITLAMTSPLYLLCVRVRVCLFICIWLLTSISDCIVHYPRRLFGWTPVSPLLLSHLYTHTNTSFIRLSIHWIARVLLLLNCRLVVAFFAVISPLHILFYALVLALIQFRTRR